MTQILIADDCPTTRALLRGNMAHLGYAVILAGDGAEALARFRTDGADLILLDVAMPGVDGIGACQAIRALPAGAAVPIIMVTAHEDEATIDRAFVAGASEFITKPIKWALLRHRLQILLRVTATDQRLRQQVAVYTGLAYDDPLTGIGNRRRFEAAWERAWASGARLALVLLDIDHFKTINDTWGHDAGDRVLGAVATRLRAGVRATDVVARIGGDEFAVLLTSAPAAGAMWELCQRWSRALCLPVDYGERSLAVGVSLWVALFPEHAATAPDLRQAADAALYRAKRGQGPVAMAPPCDGPLTADH